ncbi:MAG TPA: hypothetical protein VMT52_14660 [Planctomycetota bacterium]|nr:hypothetical protein [Planctomycetota bacterium]
MHIHRFLMTFIILLVATPTARAASTVVFESGPVRPIALSPSKSLLFAANTPDNRIEVFRVTDAGLERAGEAVVGLEPVAIAVRTESEVFVVNHLSDSVSVVDVSDPSRPFVRATLQVGDEPRDVVIAGPDRDKVFVTAAHRGQNRPGDPELTKPGVGRADVWVFRADDLAAPPAILTLFTDTPRGLASSPDGSRVYAASFHSGNQTTVLEQLTVTPDASVNAIISDGFSAPGMPPPLASTRGVTAPQTGIIVKFDGAKWRDAAGRDWSARIRFNLPDKDLFTIDASLDPPAVIGETTGVGTILFNVAVNPADGRVYVSNLESQNHIRFEPDVNGHVAENRITIVDGSTVTPVHLNPHIDYSTPSGGAEEIEQSVAFPLAMEFTRDGKTLYAAAFGSAKVAVLDQNAVVIARIDVGGGPAGLALDEDRRRLYVLNRFDQTISITDTVALQVSATVPLRHDPEPAAVREGRPVLYDARNSGHGDSACASCHIFGDFDSLAWDLGDPDGIVETNPVERVSIQGNGSLSSFHPMKGPMTTQSLRGMLGAGAMHWRGDRNGGSGDSYSEEMAFMAFRPAFQGLLGMETELPLAEMEKFRDYILTVEYPPNPIARIDGTRTALEAAGKQVFDSNGSRLGLGGDGDSCDSCHTLPLGTDGHGSFEGLTQDFKVAHLRNLYQKVGMFGYALPSIMNDAPFRLETTPTPHTGDQVRGYGFLHDGSVPTLFNFFRFPLRQFTFLDQAGRSGNQKVRELEAFLLAFDTGLAAVVGQQVTLDRAAVEANPSPGLERYGILKARAAAGASDLVVHGLAGGRARGFTYRGNNSFHSDRKDEDFTEAALLALVQAGDAILTVMAVPPGTGTRIGIDRDEDGWRNLDEEENGSDPSDAASLPLPPAPADLTASVRGNSVDLEWSPAVSPLFAIAGYKVYRSEDGGVAYTLLNAEPIIAASHTDLAAPPGVYSYRVTAIGDGREGAPSEAAEAVLEGGIPSFRRGDCNGDAGLDISDSIFALSYLFTGGLEPPCLDACNSNLDLRLDISDPVYVLQYLFGGGPPPGLYPACEPAEAPCASLDACGG